MPGATDASPAVVGGASFQLCSGAGLACGAAFACGAGLACGSASQGLPCSSAVQGTHAVWVAAQAFKEATTQSSFARKALMFPHLPPPMRFPLI